MCGITFPPKQKRPAPLASLLDLESAFRFSLRRDDIRPFVISTLRRVFKVKYLALDPEPRRFVFRLIKLVEPRR